MQYIKDQQEKIWFGSDKGVVSYDPSMENPRSLPPVLGITSIKINDEERDYSDKIILSPGNYKIRIDFLGISLKEPELVTYQYKLEGYDQWSEITKNTSITYNHLTEGDYTFYLKSLKRRWCCVGKSIDHKYYHKKACLEEMVVLSLQPSFS